MSNELLARIRKQREFKVPVGRFVFLARRPTSTEITKLVRRQQAGADPQLLLPNEDVAADYVIGWEGVTENDIVGGGGSDAVPFDAKLWREWCAERTDFWAPIASAVVDAYLAHKSVLDEQAKNSEPGSS